MYEKSIIITLVGGRTNEIPIDWRILCGRNYGNSIFLVNEVCRRDGSEYVVIVLLIREEECAFCNIFIMLIIIKDAAHVL